MEDKTQIEVLKKTREELKKLKLTKRESYQEIIIRILEYYKKTFGGIKK